MALPAILALSFSCYHNSQKISLHMMDISISPVLLTILREALERVPNSSMEPWS